jgi:hypothetical protein
MRKGLMVLVLASFTAFTPFAARAGAAGLTYHGGPVIVKAKVVFIFWGPSFSNPWSPDFAYARTLQAFRNFFGTSTEYNVITQYSGIQTSNLAAGNPDWFDASTPPANVTDTRAQTEINTYLASHAFDASTIYEVVLPSSSYSSRNGVTSCGGPSFAYCAYHSSYTSSGASAIKYSVQPYASCGGCQFSGGNAAENQEFFIGEETIDAVTDPTGTGWWNSTSGKEAVELCLLLAPPPSLGSSSPVLSYVWSNAQNQCVL